MNHVAIDCAAASAILFSLPHWTGNNGGKDSIYLYRNRPLLSGHASTISSLNSAGNCHYLPFFSYCKTGYSIEIGLTAVVSVAMRLADRFQPGHQILALQLLFQAICSTPATIAQTFNSWILPKIITYLK